MGFSWEKSRIGKRRGLLRFQKQKRFGRRSLAGSHNPTTFDKIPFETTKAASSQKLLAVILAFIGLHNASIQRPKAIRFLSTDSHLQNNRCTASVQPTINFLSALLPIAQELIKSLVQRGFEPLLHDRHDFSGQPIILFLFAFLAFFVPAHLVLTSLVIWTSAGSSASRVLRSVQSEIIFLRAAARIYSGR